jgi:LPXTG-site transpeptidase (sortase) family protein
MKEVRFEEKDVTRLFRKDTKTSRTWRKIKNAVRQIAYLALLYGLFFFIFNFGAYWTRFQYSVKPEPQVAKVQPEPPAETIPDYPPKVFIPKLGVEAPLFVDINPALIVEQLKQGVAQYSGTALPGEIGNSVIVGHSSDYIWSDGNYKNIFALLDKLVAGDQIIVQYKKEKYIYAVESSKVVGPNELSVLKRTVSPTLTLLTCYPVGTSRNRLIVTARLTSDNAGAVQENDPLTPSSLPQPR